MVEKLQQRNIGVHATIDGINDELVLFVMQNVRVFPMHGVSKIPEWSILEYVEQTVHWVNIPVTEVVVKGISPHF